MEVEPGGDSTEQDSEADPFDPQDVVDVAEEEYEAAHVLLGTPEDMTGNGSNSTRVQMDSTGNDQYVHTNATATVPSNRDESVTARDSQTAVNSPQRPRRLNARQSGRVSTPAVATGATHDWKHNRSSNRYECRICGRYTRIQKANIDS